MKKLHVSPDLSFPPEVATETLLLVGKRGSGKSSTATRLAEQLYHAHIPFAVLDPVDVWWGLKAGSDGSREGGLEVYVFGGEHADLPLEPTAGALMADVLVDHRVNAVMVLRQFSNRDKAKFVEAFAERLFTRNRDVLHLFCEEAHEVMPQEPYKDEKVMLGRMLRLQKLGRSSGIGLTSITQRPASLSKNATTQAEILIAHRILGPQDVKAVDDWIKHHHQQERRAEMLGTLGELKTGEAWVWAPDFPEADPIGLKRVKFSMPETFDSRRTPKPGEHRKEPKALVPVDLDKLRDRMVATIERAKAEDPRELRKQIAELKKQLRQKQPTTADPQAVERAVQVALKEAAREWAGTKKDLERELSQARAKLAKIAGLAGGTEITRTPELPQLSPRLEPRPRPVQEVPRPQTMTKPHANGDSIIEVGRGGLYRMLVALAQRPQGMAARSLGVRAGLSSSSGTFGTYLGQARSQGWIEGGRETLRITEEGLSALGSYDPLPEGAELLSYWLGQLGGGASRMLAALAEKYPDSMTKEELGEASGMSAQSGTFGTYLGKLRTLELVEGRSELRASEELFEGALHG